MRSITTFILLTLPLASLAAAHTHQSRHRRRHYSRRSTTYSLTDLHQGATFLDGWDFFTGSDPTHGNVQYLNQTGAAAARLAYVQSDNTTVLAVDDTTTLTSGANRNSVRISSKKSYNGGLFIADIFAMPKGCGVWPAWWTVGRTNWPNTGEVDIIEGVNTQTRNQVAFHSGPDCYVDSSVASSGNTSFTGHLLGTKCTSTQTANSGCAFSDSDTRSYGHGFNTIAGGVYALLWDNSGLKIYFFPRPEIPGDITSMAPNPGAWGPPKAFLPSSACDIQSHFQDHTLTFDVTLCGDWASSSYSSMGCPGTCADLIADPKNFAYAKWKINYVAVYQ